MKHTKGNKDIEDDGQTVLITERIIKIHTTATDKDGNKELEAGKEVTIIDTITLEGLEVGTQYKLVGWQMLKEENAELLINGKRVESDYTFTADSETMKAEVAFTFDATSLDGKQLVTFEELYDLSNPDLDNHAYQAGSETSSNVVDALDSVDELETDLDQTKESMYKLSYVIRVSAPDLDELKRRCDEVKDFYDDLNVKLVRPAGDMLGLHSEFLPASKRYINDYVQYVKSDFLAGLGFGATQQLGETTGIYMGYSVDTGRNVYLQPSLASQGVKGTVTNALASAFVGSLGGGKSFCNNLLVYYAVLFGGQALLLDPKSERGNWKETLPEIAHEINIVNLTSDKDNAGLLDPFVIMKNVKDAESLAIDILTFLTGISSRDGEKFPVLRKAVRSVTQSDSRGLLHVIDELRREDTPISRNIADHIDSFTDYDFAHLLFSDGTVENAISLDNQLNIIQVADLVLPDKDTTFEEYTTIELLSVSMLIVISTFALDFIHSDRSIFKIVDLDEAWAFLNVAQGETLSNKLVRAGRAMQAGVYFVTQSSGDVSKESLKNNIGLKFAFRSTDINEIKQTLEFFGIDKDDENNQKRLRDLENGQCLLQDLYGRVGVVQIHPVFEELLHAFDTRPPVQRNEVE